MAWRTADFPFQQVPTVLAAELAATGDAIVALTLGPQLAVIERRGPGGPWGAAAPLVAEDGDRSLAGRPIVRLNGRGQALAVWTTASGRVVAARRERGGPWSAGLATGTDLVTSRFARLRAALGDDGRARVATSSCGEQQPFRCLVRVAGQAAGGRPWERVAADLELPQPPDVALDCAGRAVAAWVASEGPSLAGAPVFAVTLGTAGWGPPETVSVQPAEGAPSSVAVAVGDGGGAAVAWTVALPGTSGAGVRAAVRRAGGSWAAPAALSPDGARAIEPAVAVNVRGDVLTAWRQLSTGGEAVTAALSPRGGGFGHAQTILVTDDSEGGASVGSVAPHLSAGRAVVLVQLQSHGAQTTPAAYGTAIDGAPAWRSLGVPDWPSGERAIAFAPTGAGLVAGRPYEALLRVPVLRAPHILRLESYDAVAAPPRPRVSEVRLVRTARGRALALTLSRRARVRITLVHPVGTDPPRVELPARTLGAGRRLLPVRGLTERRYNVLIQLCTSAGGCEDAPVVVVRPT
jgi:hypothetical protein